MSCDRCQLQNKLKKLVGTLHPIPVKSKLFYQMGMDLIGPLPETTRGNKYIVTVTDYFSKWAEAAPLPSKHAVGISKLIYSVIFFCYSLNMLISYSCCCFFIGNVSIWLPSYFDY